ncbi:MAG: hypothetical protein ACNS63_12755 [Candidatus Nitrospinota bacterium M3_3B_026]
MSIGLPNTKIGGGQLVQRPGLASRRHKVAPSIAEQAIFIPKPRKRVDFKMNVPGGGDPIPLPGSGKTAEAKVADSMTRGELGQNGLTARFGRNAWSGSPAGYVKMEVDLSPQKQHHVIATQEEGRQVNHGQVHFTQQYDTYGRPRIGFSREPYDFAATKYMSITSQVAFQKNISETRENFDKYLLNGAGGEEDQKAAGQKEKSPEIPIFGSTSSFEDDMKKLEPEDMFLGPEPKALKKPVGMSAEEAFKAQRAKSGGKESGDSVAGAVFSGEIDTGSVRTLDVSA